jgi:hypothetical protein
MLYIVIVFLFVQYVVPIFPTFEYSYLSRIFTKSMITVYICCQKLPQ